MPKVQEIITTTICKVQALAPFSSLLLIVRLTWDNSQPGRNSDFYAIPITI
jgi:hypothetical protein